jgi:hypothetical protein
MNQTEDLGRLLQRPDSIEADCLVSLDAGLRPTASPVLALLATLRFPAVGIVGGKTLDRTQRFVVQAGLSVRSNGQLFRLFSGLTEFPQRSFYLNLKDLSREVSAVWPGCCAFTRDLLMQLGPAQLLAPDLALVDLCLRAAESGQPPLYVPAASFASEGEPPALSTVPEGWKWPEYSDPYWNPNLSALSDGLPFRP